MNLGNFLFELKTIVPDSFERTTEYNWAEKAKIGGLPELQNLGLSKDQIQIEGVFYPKFKSRRSWTNIVGLSAVYMAEDVLTLSNREPIHYETIDEIRESDLCKKGNFLINDRGEILGKFVIVSVKENQTYFDKTGMPQKIEFTLVLKRSPASNSECTTAPMHTDPNADWMPLKTMMRRIFPW